MMRDIFIRTNNLNWVDYLQIMCDNKNNQYNQTTKNKPNNLWNEDSYYFNIDKNKREMPDLENNISVEGERIQARENIKAKAKQIVEKINQNN